MTWKRPAFRHSFVAEATHPPARGAGRDDHGPGRGPRSVQAARVEPHGVRPGRRRRCGSGCDGPSGSRLPELGSPKSHSQPVGVFDEASAKATGEPAVRRRRRKGEARGGRRADRGRAVEVLHRLDVVGLRSLRLRRRNARAHDRQVPVGRPGGRVDALELVRMVKPEHVPDLVHHGRLEGPRGVTGIAGRLAHRDTPGGRAVERRVAAIRHGLARHLAGTAQADRSAGSSRSGWTTPRRRPPGWTWRRGAR